MPLVPTEHLHSISVESFTHAKWTCPAPFIHVGQENVERCAWPHSSPMWSNGWGKKNPTLNLIFLQAVFSPDCFPVSTLLPRFSSPYTERPSSPCFYIHTSLILSDAWHLCIWFFCSLALTVYYSAFMFIWERASLSVYCNAPYIFLYRHHGLIEPWVKD